MAMAHKCKRSRGGFAPVATSQRLTWRRIWSARGARTSAACGARPEGEAEDALLRLEEEEEDDDAIVDSSFED